MVCFGVKHWSHGRALARSARAWLVNSEMGAKKKHAPFLRSRVGAAAESDMWPFSVTEGSTSRVSAFIISSADCVLRIPSVAAPTSASRPDAMVGRESVGFAAFDWLAWCRERAARGCRGCVNE